MTAVDVKWWGDTTDKATLSGAISWHALKVGSGVTLCGRTVQTGAQLTGDELDGTGAVLCPTCLQGTSPGGIKLSRVDRYLAEDLAANMALLGEVSAARYDEGQDGDGFTFERRATPSHFQRWNGYHATNWSGVKAVAEQLAGDPRWVENATP